MTTQTAPIVPTDPKELEKVLLRARNGDEKALPVVRAMLKDAAAVDRLGGDLARVAEQELISATTGAKNLAFREALIRKLELLRAELAGPAPTPLERLLVERIGACWLQLHLAEAMLAQQGHNLNRVQLEYKERSRDRAHKRYLAAIKALALIRKRVLPVLQVNVAKKQVNVAGPCVPAEAM
jgi:hypothetical protein